LEAREVRLRKGLGRILNVFFLIRRSRRAIFGTSIIVFYILIALFAPLLTSNDPVYAQNLAANYAAPSWYRTLTFEKGLSANQLVPSQTSTGAFDTQDSISQYTLTTNNPGAVSFQYSPTVGHNAAGSLQVNVAPRTSGSIYGGINFTVESRFNYPYDGPPGRFVGTGSVLFHLSGATPSTVAALFTIDRIGNQSYRVASADSLAQQPYNLWYTPNPQIDSLDSSLQTSSIFRAASQRGILPNALVFSSMGSYSFKLVVTIADTDLSQPFSGIVYLDDISLRLYGTSYGLLGTDYVGRDLFSQLVYGARVSLLVGLLAAGIAVGVGLVVGLVAGFKAGVLDEVLMRFTDMLLVLPGLPLILVLVAILSPSLTSIITVIALLGWMGFARVIRSQVVTLKERPFVEASRAVGAGTGHLIRQHILPNVMGLTYVSLATSVPAAITLEAALSFLGLFDPFVMSWGRMLNNAESFQGFFFWWWFVPPGISIALLSLSFILVGYGIDDILNPRLRQRR